MFRLMANWRTICLATALLSAGVDDAFAGDSNPALPAGLDVASISSLARSVLVESIPESIQSEKDWDKQAERPALKFKGQGLKTRLEKTEKPVNHGLWKKYRIEPIDPKARLKLSLHSLKALPDGGFGFELRISAPVFATATVEQWTWGLRTFHATVDADAEATAVLTCEVRTSLQSGTLLPVVKLEPKVVASKVDLDEFRLRKLGDLPKPLARELSDDARRIVLHYLKKNEAKIAAKANAALEKRSKAGKLTFAPIPFLR